ncbi:hypothetical protein [Rhizobium rhizogenes]|uniref:hypothetical protein n=1 Tax=Rhizobium rhizogenes TaxID=359 RepID=UPI0024BDFC6A|nr:hypothetical protein [Rhizobium rhizogenes]MDJ1632299.1 hypothetical protein [Rhizobium rhizogenes]
MITAEIIEEVARAWASIDGNGELFDSCKVSREQEKALGHYGGYMAEAEELFRRSPKFTAAFALIPGQPAFLMCEACGTLVDDRRECDCTKLGTDTQRIVGLYRGPVDREGLLEEARKVIEPFANAARNFTFAIGPDGIDDGLTVLAYVHVCREREADLSTADFSAASAFLSKLEASHAKA